MSDPLESPEFSRPLLLATVGTPGRRERLVADEAECAALAVRFGLLALKRLDADLTILPEAGGAWRVSGRLEADVVQSCVVSLGPVPQRVSEPLDWRVVPAGGQEDEDMDTDGPDPVEAVDGVLDMGEAAAQSLSLALDPYPRAEGAILDGSARAENANPFAGLAALKRTD